MAFVACAAAAAVSFDRMDVRVARHFWQVGRHLSSLSTAFGAAVILALEAAVVLGLMLARLVHGHLSRLGETLGVACLASICAYGINDQVLKPLFGVPPPAEVLHGARHAFFALSFGNGSFPSGHMVLAGAFAGVFMKFYRTSIWPLAALLLLAAVLLVVGDWHFLSDVIAGSFLGVSAGILAGEAWATHLYER
ncbi:MAG TPA: phosphatase PAP2 family protein [Steroidobacteraceae bacterium]|nr:phosphatase PAP2 family protein [Steroidobacteraceae bacterium]